MHKQTGSVCLAVGQAGIGKVGIFISLLKVPALKDGLMHLDQ
mgnify:CR=1 FL=1